MTDPILALYLDKWNLTPDGASFRTNSSLLQPCVSNGSKAMLKIPFIEEELRASKLLQWWDGKASAKVLNVDAKAILLERVENEDNIILHEQFTFIRKVRHFYRRELQILHEQFTFIRRVRHFYRRELQILHEQFTFIRKVRHFYRRELQTLYEQFTFIHKVRQFHRRALQILHEQFTFIHKVRQFHRRELQILHERFTFIRRVRQSYRRELQNLHERFTFIRKIRHFYRRELQILHEQFTFIHEQHKTSLHPENHLQMAQTSILHLFLSLINKSKRVK